MKIVLQIAFSYMNLDVLIAEHVLIVEDISFGVAVEVDIIGIIFVQERLEE